MTNEQPVLLQKLHVILQRSLVESRNLALAQRCQQIYDLADTVEIIPTFLAHWDSKHLEVIRAGLGHYQATYQGTAYDYLSILEMDDCEFQHVFGAEAAAPCLDQPSNNEPCP